MIHLGYEHGSGEPAVIPEMHTFLTGITRHGKSETMGAMARTAADQGYTVLLFDVKSNRDYEDIGTEVPIYLEEATDPTTLKGLLENSADMSLSFQYSELIKVYEPGDDYRDVLYRMEDLMDDDVHPVEEDKLRVLHHLLRNLVGELNAVDISDTLDLAPGINVMDLSAVDDSIQQLAVASSVEAVLQDRADTIIGVDEAHNFIPQRGSPPANDPVATVIREGAAKNVWLWLSDQTITGVDKDPLKQVSVWLLGKQREKNEAERVLEQIPGKSAYSSEDVMTLDKGHFIVALDDSQPLVYVRPRWMDGDTAEAIATGEISMDEANTDADEEVEEIEQQLQEKDATIRDLRERLQEREERIETLEEKVEEMDEMLEQVEEQRPQATYTMEPMPEREEEFEEWDGGTDLAGADVDLDVEPDWDDPAAEWAEAVDSRIEARFEELIEEREIPETVRVDESSPALVVTRTVEPLELSEDSLLGKVAILYAEGELPEDEWFTTGLLHDLFQARGWDDDPRRSQKIDDLATWGYFERKYQDETRHYRVKMTPEEARDRGLLEHEVVRP